MVDGCASHSFLSTLLNPRPWWQATLTCLLAGWSERTYVRGDTGTRRRTVLATLRRTKPVGLITKLAVVMLLLLAT